MNLFPLLYFYACLFLLYTACSDIEESPTIESPTEETSKTKMFTLMPQDYTGIFFNNIIREDYSRNVFNYEYFYNGGGVAVIDVNNDGLQDLFFTGNMVEARLYLNHSLFRFEDITQQAGVGGGNGWSTGVTIADINCDGFQDIYVCRSGAYTIPEMRKNLLYINNGNLTFTEKANAYGLDHKGYSTQAAFFDYDKDGDLDMYLMNHPISFNRAVNPLHREKSDPRWSSDRLYRNDGNNKFTDVTEKAGILNDAFGLGLAVSDVNNDGLPDVYIANDYIEPDYLYINNGNGTFTESIKKATKHISNYGMGVDIADFNNDGLTDIIVLDMLAENYKRSKTMMGAMDIHKFNKTVEMGYHHQYMRNSLQLNNDNGTFSEIAQLAGVASTDWSWAPLLADFDNDGFKDLFVTNGYFRDVTNKDFIHFTMEAARTRGGNATFDIMQALNMIPSVKLKNYIFKNNGDLTFKNTSGNWGIDSASFSNGAACADLDNDGDLDIIINNINDYAFIYKNNLNIAQGNNYLKIMLSGPENNKMGIGAKVILKTGGITQLQEAFNVRGFQSAVSPVLHFGLRNTNKVDEVKVIWPDNKVQVFTNVLVNQQFTVNYNEQSVADEKDKDAGEEIIFSEITGKKGLNYSHKENPYNDFEKEILLPHKQSQHGPGIAAGDVNGDGLGDFFIGGAAGYSGELFVQQSDDSFKKSISRTWENDKSCEDIGAAFFDADNDGYQDLYVVSGGNEFAENSILLQDRLYINKGKGVFSKSTGALPEMISSGSCVKPCDYDHDGDMDLFVGGRIIPGKYPLPPKSYILNNVNGKFTDVTKDIAPQLEQIGLVTDAVWTDYDNDHDDDMIVVGEWLPITIFTNEKGLFKNTTDNMKLLHTTGWWNCISKGDFDNDGDDDFAIGNLGLNTKYHASPEEPLHVYCADFDRSGTLDIVLAQHYENVCYPVRGKQCSSQQMPFISKKFPSYDQFASSDLVQIYGKNLLESSLHYTAAMLSSVFIFNDNGKFRVVPMPKPAQISCVNAILCNDFNHDGFSDLLIAGNSSAPEVETGSNDALTGLFLAGDGKGNFKVVPNKKSGFFADKPVNDLKMVKGKKTNYIIVGNNNAAMQVFVF